MLCLAKTFAARPTLPPTHNGGSTTSSRSTAQPTFADFSKLISGYRHLRLGEFEIQRQVDLYLEKIPFDPIEKIKFIPTFKIWARENPYALPLAQALYYALGQQDHWHGFLIHHILQNIFERSDSRKNLISFFNLCTEGLTEKKLTEFYSNLVRDEEDPTCENPLETINYAKNDLDKITSRAEAPAIHSLRIRYLNRLICEEALACQIKELAHSDDEAPSTWERMEDLYNEGQEPESIVQALLAQPIHTGYTNDPRIARKLVSLFFELGRMEDQVIQLESLTQQDDAALTQHEVATIENLVRFLEGEGVNVQFHPDSEKINQLWKEHGLTCRALALFVYGGTVQDTVHVVKSRKELKCLSQLRRDLAHETDHWKQWRRRWTGLEVNSNKEPKKGQKLEQITREVLSTLEEYRDPTFSHPENIWEISRILGISPVTFLRMANQ